ncbi:MAG TPA: DinB family protein [Chitinophagaceae bacterium]|nr:DinB family protein [Chitinophagaceae bacterium]
MTKNYFIQLADYNLWANDIVHSWLNKVTDEQWEQTVISSFDSIAETSLHIAAAETVWLDRLNNAAAPVWLPSVFKGSKNETLDVWNKASKNLKSFIENFDETKLQINLSFKRLNGDAYEMPHYQVLAHVFNHSSYHRGQIVTMLRQVGFAGVGSTDMLGFFRK